MTSGAERGDPVVPSRRTAQAGGMQLRSPLKANAGAPPLPSKGGRARAVTVLAAAATGVLVGAAAVASLAAPALRQSYARGMKDYRRMAACNGAAEEPALDGPPPRQALQSPDDGGTAPVGRALELTHGDLSAMANYVYFSDEHRLILTCLPKVASSWTLKLMLRMCGENHDSWDPNMRSGRLHMLRTRRAHMVSLLTPAEATRRFLDPSYTRAIVVRDPLERLLSAYQDKIIGERANERESRGWWDMNKTLNSFAMQEGRAMPTFKEFATWVSSYPYPEVGGTGAMGLRTPLAYNPFSAHVFVPFAPRPVEKDLERYRRLPERRWRRTLSKRWTDPHWRPQSTLAALPKTAGLYDRVINLADGHEGIKALLKSLGPDVWERYGADGWGRAGNESFMQPGVARADAAHETSAHERMREAYEGDLDLMSRVAATYWADYATFAPVLRYPPGIFPDIAESSFARP